MLLKSIKVKSMLSFRDMSLDLRPLNVLIGPNASGKSNLIEMVALLQAAPRDLAGFVRRSGGISDWFWKGERGTGENGDGGSIEVLLESPEGSMPVRYILDLARRGQVLDVLAERLENEKPFPRYDNPYYFFRIAEGQGRVAVRDSEEGSHSQYISTEDLTPGQSLLREIREPTLYPIVTSIGKQLNSIRLYREWNLGKIRGPQPTDLPNDFLDEDFSNLALVLNQLEVEASFREIERNLQHFYEIYERVIVGIQANTAQLRIREKGGLANVIPATRLSDGTLRFLSLLVILCHPKPPPLICIEEPELGLHPDIIPRIAELLKSASERTQLIITTHSEKLIDELSDDPESVVICERDPEFGSEFQRLSKQELESWLERYQLGELWQKGEIGGTRW